MHELNLVDVQKRYKEKDAVIGFTFTFSKMESMVCWGKMEQEKQH